MVIFIKIVQFLLSLSILVILHEFGHFFFAKLFKTRVEKFYMFFDPWFSLFKFKKGDTEYGIGWLPLGGYVKIAGMIDESMDTDQMKKPAQAWEFRAKPAWQRLLIMLGGVMVNVLLAFVIYIGVLFAWGETYLPAENATYGVVCDSVFTDMGVQKGDIIYALDSVPVERFSNIIPDILLNESKTMTVKRNGKLEVLKIPSTLVASLLDISSKSTKMRMLIAPRVLVKDGIAIGSFADYSPAYDAGVRKGDKLIAINDIHVDFYDELNELVKKGRGGDMNMKVVRGIDTLDFTFHLKENEILGVAYYASNGDFEFKTKKYSFFAAIPAGVTMGYDQLGSYLKQLKLLFNHKESAYKSVGGFMSIGNIFPGVWDWHVFWRLTALISIMLAVVNMLPIPALDGGHVLFLLYEVVTNRRPGEKFMEYAQMLGMIFILGLFILANVNDIIKFFG